MQNVRALIPFVLVLAAGCNSATPSATRPLIYSAKSTSTIAPADTAVSADLPAVTPPTMTPSMMPQVVLLIDDFEEDTAAWTVCTDPECTDSSAVDVVLTPDHATHGIRALQLNFEKNDKPKAVFYIERPMDLSGGRSVSFDIFHAGTIDGVGLALTTGPDSVWHESDMISVEAGKIVTLSFDITAGNFKTAATQWEFRAFIADLDQVVRLSIVLYPKKAGSVIMDYLILTE